MGQVITVDNLVYEYPTKRALHGVSFEVDEASVIAMVGPNGAGKTTLLRCLAALEMPFKGRVKIFEHDTEVAPRECHRLVGYLSDFFGLYEDLTVKRCLLHAGAMQGLSGDTLTRSTEQVANDLEITEYMDQRSGTLSRGLKQRLAIAQAIIHEPRILLMDEPASGLDPEARSKLAQLIRRLASQKMTILVSSHILAELESYCTHMLTVDGGRILGFTPIGAESTTAERMLSISLSAPYPDLRELLANASNVRVESVTHLEAVIAFSGGQEEQAVLLRTLIQGGAPVLGFAEETRSMQEIYLAQLEEKRAKERRK